ncbi:hypothetical protein HNQ64_000308 [Prosthecobacter dejongeii]|uniref:Uncharacterized protein n=1 Tax=Prosthecobacter dejongeii TaxID=48465 RepID=A0A7W7YH85_9BACT|nr:hypothetical protein [Prosthecobacter dejongeii]
MNAPQTPPLRAGWYAKKCESLDSMRTENIRFWQNQGGAAIRQAAWELVIESWKQQKRNLDELRFQRSPSPLRSE